MRNNSKKFTTEYALLDAVIGMLYDKEYSPASIRKEWTEAGNVFDIAIVDPAIEEAIAFIEVALDSRLIRTTTGLRASLSRYQKTQNKHNVPLFLVNATEGGDSFEIAIVTPETRDTPHPTILPITLDKFPSFSDLRLSVLGEVRSKAQNVFDWIIFGLAFSCLILLVLDAFDWYLLTVERLALIGVIFGLLVLPQAQRVRVLNFEFERRADK